MTKLFRIACIIGTRPEVIKMAPLIQRLQKEPCIEIIIINTAQHRKLLDDMLNIFGLKPDIDLNIMQEKQSLSSLTARLFMALDPIFEANKFDMVIAQGDTTTTLVAAQSAYYHHVPFAHLEAGLRSYDLSHPFPEEANRVLVSKLAALHFAPSQLETDILLKEQVASAKILTAGNTVIDALLSLKDRPLSLPFPTDEKRIILVTLHRRESFGAPIKAILEALRELVLRFSDIEILYPVHPNPEVYQTAHHLLANIERIHLLEPLPYDQFVALMKTAYLIMTDSGGMQEEAPALNKPLLILRHVTERPLVVQAGAGLLVGSDKNKIVETAARLLTDAQAYQAMQKGISPYGDGRAADRIGQFIVNYLQTCAQ